MTRALTGATRVPIPKLGGSCRSPRSGPSAGARRRFGERRRIDMHLTRRLAIYLELIDRAAEPIAGNWREAPTVVSVLEDQPSLRRFQGATAANGQVTIVLVAAIVIG